MAGAGCHPLPTYLTGASNVHVRAIAREKGIGLLVRPGNGYLRHVSDYACWAADNGQYTTKPGSAPTDAEWWAWLVNAVEVAGAGGCLFATAPDVLHVIEGEDGRPIVIGDAAATIERSRPWLARIRELGVPAALVAQDGAEDLELPWDEFDVLFLGGSTEWKIGPAAEALTREARARGIRVHMGRVNSGKRLRIAAGWGVNTVDGTFLAFGPEKNLPRLLAWYGHDDERQSHDDTPSGPEGTGRGRAEDIRVAAAPAARVRGHQCDLGAQVLPQAVPSPVGGQDDGRARRRQVRLPGRHDPGGRKGRHQVAQGRALE